MIAVINTILMAATIGFGLIGWFKPHYTMEKLGLQLVDGRRLGLSEVRAVNGCLFVVVGVAALIINEPLGFAMVGFMYAGAALGRISSFVMDKSGEFLSRSFAAAELAFAVVLLTINLR